MTILQAIVLGILQGVTEFLPISSSGHLLLVQHLLGLNDVPLFFDVMLHVASLAAIVIYFLPKWIKLPKKMFYLVILATIPAVIAGAIIEPIFAQVFRNLTIAGIGFLITGCLMFVAHRLMKTSAPAQLLNSKKALIIGLIQAFAITPGISRSGSTITAALWQKMSHDEAFSFAFLMAVPAIAGAFGLSVLKGVPLDVPLATAAWGFVASLLMSLFSLKLLRLVLHQQKLYFFGVYCFVIGITTLLLALK